MNFQKSWQKFQKARNNLEIYGLLDQISKNKKLVTMCCLM